MLALVAGHVDVGGGLPRHANGRLGDGIGRTDKGIDRPVGIGTGIDVEERDLIHGAYGRRNRLNRLAIAALRDIRHALDELPHFTAIIATRH